METKELEKEFLSMIEEQKRTIYKVCYMYANDQDDLNDLFQETAGLHAIHLGMVSCPKLLFARIFHFALTLGAGLHVPYTDVIAATLQTQTSHLASIRWCHVGYDTTHHNVLDGLTVWAGHRRNLLTKQSSSLIHLSLIATGLTAIFQFPCHL